MNFLIGNFVNQLMHLPDYPGGSILLLFKETKESPANERFQVLLFKLKTGKRKEYLNYMLQNIDFHKHFIYPNYDMSSDLSQVENEYNNLVPDAFGRRFWP
jgi:hypothetical protein